MEIRSCPPMVELRRFAVNLFVLVIAALLKSSNACCAHHPIFSDVCYARASQIVILRWNPPQSCEAVGKYEVLYTSAVCNASNATTVNFTTTNETNVNLPSSEVYCIQVRAVINENCFSSYSTCAQVASLEQDQNFNVMMQGEICIPVTVCPTRLSSRIILSSTSEQLHLPWNELAMRHNVNLIYNNTTDTYQFCFSNVTESFLFLEYCDINGMPCERDSTFCCNSWDTFVSRTRVNVEGENVTPSRVPEAPAGTEGTIVTTRTLSSQYPSVIPSCVPCATPSPPPDNTVPILGALVGLLVITLLIVLVLSVVCHCRRRQ